MQHSDPTSRRRVAEDFELTVGRSIRQERLRQGLSQAELADRMADMGFSTIQTTIAKIEAGTRPLRLSEFMGVAAALGVTWHGLLATTGVTLGDGDPLLQVEQQLNDMISAEESALEELTDETKRMATTYAMLRARRERLALELKDLVKAQDGKASNPGQ